MFEEFFFILFISSIEATPPETTTGISVNLEKFKVSKIFGPVFVQSLSMSV